MLFIKQSILRLLRRIYYSAISLRLANPARILVDGKNASDGPIVVAGLFHTGSGIGESARRCADALEGGGHIVYRCDLSGEFRQSDLPPDGKVVSFPAGHTGTLILHLNAPETIKGLNALGYHGKKNWRVIGYWAWELETLPVSWKRATRHLSEVWTPSEFSASAIRKSIDIPVRVVPHYVTQPRTISSNSFRSQIPDTATVFLLAADGKSSLDRKNILGGVSAFLKGVGQNKNCWLIIKTRNINHHRKLHADLKQKIEGHPQILFIDKSVNEDEKWRLIADCDAFISLHRSEGFGLVLAEAMAMAKPVVATAWSGNMDFMTHDTAYLVPYELILMSDKAGVYRGKRNANLWADAKIEYAAGCLKKICEDRTGASIVGQKAQAHIKDVLNGQQYLEWL